MKKSENLVATLLAVYAIILTLCIAIYAIFKLLDVNITLATNLLIWSATIFAPIAVLMTYTSWKEQKSAETIAYQSNDVFKINIRYCRILEEYSITWPKRNDLPLVTKKLEVYFESIYPTLILYCDFLRELKKDSLAEDFVKLERAHHNLLQVMEAIDEEDDIEKWCEYSNEYPKYSADTINIIKSINSQLVKIILHKSSD